MNYYIQQRFFIYYMAEEKIFKAASTDAALGKTVFLR